MSRHKCTKELYKAFLQASSVRFDVDKSAFFSSFTVRLHYLKACQSASLLSNPLPTKDLPKPEMMLEQILFYLGQQKFTNEVTRDHLKKSYESIAEVSRSFSTEKQKVVLKNKIAKLSNTTNTMPHRDTNNTHSTSVRSFC